MTEEKKKNANKEEVKVKMTYLITGSVPGAAQCGLKVSLSTRQKKKIFDKILIAFLQNKIIYFHHCKT